MHYYGTYVLARAAGLKAETAGVIAYASQFVDDSTEEDIGPHPTGARFKAEVTAHHPTSLPANLNEDDQRLVWLPFHFLPGGEGTELTQKLVCVRNSENAREMVKHHLDLMDKPFAAELAGITAHVYADTFAHYGFSGVSSRLNRVQTSQITVHSVTDAVSSFLPERVANFFRKKGEQGGLMANIRQIIGGSAQAMSGALGHGAVAIYPDQPYLEWDFLYELPFPQCRSSKSERNNRQDFLMGSELLHTFFGEVARRRPDFADGASRRDWDDIRPHIETQLAIEADIQGRSAGWCTLLMSGKLFKPSESEIPAYGPDAWNQQRQQLTTLIPVGKAPRLPLYRFYQAASLHRHYVLRELLPAKGIVVI